MLVENAERECVCGSAFFPCGELLGDRFVFWLLRVVSDDFVEPVLGAQVIPEWNVVPFFTLSVGGSMQGIPTM